MTFKFPWAKKTFVVVLIDDFMNGFGDMAFLGRFDGFGVRGMVLFKCFEILYESGLTADKYCDR